jgi:hypothetical protein
VKKSHLRISFGDIHDRSHGGDGSHDTHPIKTLLRKGKRKNLMNFQEEKRKLLTVMFFKEGFQGRFSSLTELHLRRGMSREGREREK